MGLFFLYCLFFKPRLMYHSHAEQVNSWHWNCYQTVKIWYVLCLLWPNSKWIQLKKKKFWWWFFYVHCCWANQLWLWSFIFSLLTEPDLCFCTVLRWRPEGSWEIQRKWLQPVLSLVLWHHRLLHWNQRCKTQRCCGSKECGDGGM